MIEAGRLVRAERRARRPRPIETGRRSRLGRAAARPRHRRRPSCSPPSAPATTRPRLPMSIAWAEVDERDVLALPGLVHVPDPEHRRVPHQPGRPLRAGPPGAHAGDAPRPAPRPGGRRRAARRGRGGAGARGRAGRAGPRDWPARRCPTPAPRRRPPSRQASARLQDARLDAEVVGGAAAFGADSFNEQVIQGLRAEEATAMTLTPDALDRYARDYYLSDEIADIDIEERAQRLSAPTVAAKVGDARRVHRHGLRHRRDGPRAARPRHAPPRWWRARPCSPPRRASATPAWWSTRRCSRTSPPARSTTPCWRST